MKGNIQDVEDFVGFKNLCREKTIISEKLQNILEKMYINAAEKSIDNMAGVKKLAKNDKDTLIVTALMLKVRLSENFLKMNTQEKSLNQYAKLKYRAIEKIRLVIVLLR